MLFLTLNQKNVDQRVKIKITIWFGLVPPRTLDSVLPASFRLRRRLHWVGETTCTANTCIRENWRRELQQRVSVPLWQILCGKFYLIEGKSKP